jgi:hypothetical protein
VGDAFVAVYVVAGTSGVGDDNVYELGGGMCDMHGMC